MIRITREPRTEVLVSVVLVRPLDRSGEGEGEEGGDE
jgi:hypothetical protein